MNYLQRYKNQTMCWHKMSLLVPEYLLVGSFRMPHLLL